MYILLKQESKGNNIYEFMRICRLIKMSLNYLIRKIFFRKNSRGAVKKNENCL